MRGEKYNNRYDIYGDPGSSPHARGKDDFFRSCTEHIRIIPACAGKRISKWNSRDITQDHPRMRGEKRHQSYSR